MTTGFGNISEVIDYNSIKNKVDLVFGIGLNDNGYGQPITSSTVNKGDLIGVNEWSSLRNDMIKSRQHQTGVVIGETSDTDTYNLLPITSDTIITETIRHQYDIFSNQLLIDKFLVHDSQLTISSLVDGVRTTPWAGTVTHNIDIVGNTLGNGSAENFRYFFNAGGKITIEPSRSGGINSSINLKWTEFFNKIGIITLSHHSTYKSGGLGDNTIFGFHELTEDDKLIFSASTMGTTSLHVLSLEVYGRVDANKDHIYLTIKYINNENTNPENDDDNFSKNVSGNLYSVIKQHVPSGSNVNVYSYSATHNGLDLGIAPERYRAITTVTAANEGSTLEYLIQCSNPGVKSLKWETIGNVTAVDFEDNILYGDITLNVDGDITITRQIAEDYVTEGSEQFSIRVKDTSDNILCTSKPLTINDTTVYSMTVSDFTVSEGQTITFTINSSDRAIGNVIYVTLAGTIDDNDIVGGINRTLTFTSSSITSSITIANDVITDVDEYFTIQIRSGSYSGQLLMQSNIIYILDTSPRYNISVTGSSHVISSTGSTVFSSPGSFVWTVPSWVSSVTATLYGGGGGSGGPRWTGGKNDWYGGFVGAGGPGGNGGVSQVSVNVNPGYSFVGYIGGGGGAGYGYRAGTGYYGGTTSFTYTGTGVGYAVGGGAGGCWGCYGNSGGVPAPYTPYGRGGSGSGSSYGTGHSGNPGAVVLSWTVNQVINDPFVNATEGNAVNFTVHTANVPNGSIVYYNPSGNVTDSDFTGGIWGRYLTINDNIGYGSIGIRNDGESEGSETFYIQLRVGGQQSTVVSTSMPIDIYPGGRVIFTNIGQTSWNIPSGVNKISYTIVGGGGGGGSSVGTSGGWSGGGGGSGGVYTGVSEVTPGSSVVAVVGSGGSANNNGGESAIYINNTRWVAVGGGAGGSSRYGGNGGYGGVKGADGVWASTANDYAKGGLGGVNNTGYGTGGNGAVLFGRGYNGYNGSSGLVMISW